MQGTWWGNGKLEMEEDKTDKIKNSPQPKPKKQVRSFLGLTGFYRMFVPGYAQIASPLIDLTKKRLPNNVHWTSTKQKSFETLTEMLTQSPFLRLPDFSGKFCLVPVRCFRIWVGACLLQEFDDGYFQLHMQVKNFYKGRRIIPLLEENT